MNPKQVLVQIAFIGLLVYTGWRGRLPAEREPADEISAQKHGFVLRESAEEVGLRFRHESPRLDARLDPIAPQVAGVGAAVSLIDFDGDGALDVYATTSVHGRPNALFRNDGKGGFVDVAAEVGLADLNVVGEGCSTGSYWADFDRDGDLDVLVTRWGNQVLLRNDGGKFVDVTAEAGLERWMNCNAATWFDFDRDGYPDLFLGGYYREDIDLWNLSSTRIMQESFEYSSNGGRNFLYRNLGNGRFEDATALIQGETKRWTFAVAAADFDGDGWQDLYLANDYGPEELWLNREGRAFELARDTGLETTSKSGMAVALGDFMNRGELAIYVTNISQPRFLFQGNNLRLNRMRDGGGLPNVASGPEVNCGWSWGAQFADLDGDGFQDLVVVNGFVSASRENDYWYNMSKIAGGFGGIFEDALNWPAFGELSLSGYERTRVLLNRRGQSFREVGEDVGIRDVFDGRAIAVGDLDNDGAPDLVVANQNGPLLYYRNERSNEHRWIGFDLRGTASNLEAYGAELLVRFGPHVQRRHVVSSSGFSGQSDRRVLVGLGEHEEVAEGVDEGVLVGGLAGGVAVVGGGAGAGLRDALEGLALVLGEGAHGLDQVRDQVVAALELGVDRGPGLVAGVAQAH